MNKINKDILHVVITCVMWGLLPILIKFMALNFSNITIVWLRFFIALICELIYIYTKNGKVITFKFLSRNQIIAGSCLVLNYFCFIKGIELTSPSFSQVLMQLGPILLGLYGLLIFKEQLNRFQFLGITFMILGLFVFYKEQMTLLTLLGASYTDGILWLLLGAVSWSIYAFFLKLESKKSRENNINIFSFLIGSVVFLPFIEFESLLEINKVNMLSLIYLGLNTFIIYNLLRIGLAKIPASTISIILSFNPIVTIFGMYLISVLNLTDIPSERISFSAIIGVLIMIIGSILFARKKEY